MFIMVSLVQMLSVVFKKEVFCFLYIMFAYLEALVTLNIIILVTTNHTLENIQHLYLGVDQGPLVVIILFLSLCFQNRNPDPHKRPSFDYAFRHLRHPEELLLHWSEEDKAIDRHLLRGLELREAFVDLQKKYMAEQPTPF